MNATKSKVLVFEKTSNTKFTIVLDGQKMKSVKTFKHFESVMSKDDGVNDEVRECTWPTREKGGRNPRGSNKKQKSW